LEDRLQMSLSISEQTTKNYEMDKSLWEQTEATLTEKIENLMLKYNEAKKEAADNEKVRFSNGGLNNVFILFNVVMPLL